MSTIIEPSKGTAPQIDDGLYTVTCTGIRSMTVDNDAFGNFEKIELALQIQGVLDENGDAMSLDPRVNRKWNERATLYKYAVAFGVVASPSEPFDAEDLIGKRAQALIETPTEGGWPRVTKMTALKGKQATAQKAQEAPSEGATPFDTDEVVVDSLDAWTAKLRSIGYTPVEIRDHALAAYDRTPDKLTAIEREELAKSLGV